MNDYFGVTNCVSRTRIDLIQQLRRDFGILNTFDFSTMVTHEMGVLVFLRMGQIPYRISPGPVFTSDPMHQFLGHERIQRSINRDRLGKGR
jgi:hypothetical protein